jgi:outer membrane protein assembly factor BamD
MFSSCASQFEKVRTSNDPKLILNKANEYFEKEEYLSAQALYELALQFYRGKEEAESIFFNLAYTYYHTGEYITASHYFQNFSSTFSNSQRKEEADYMYAYSFYKLSPNFKLDQSYSIKASEAFQLFANKYPDSKRLTEVNNLLDDIRRKLEQKAFHQGYLYHQLSQYQSSVRSLEILLKDYPGSPFEDQAKLLLIKSSYNLADNSIEEKKLERFEETSSYCQKYMDKLKDKKANKEIKDIHKQCISKIKSLKA